MVNSLCNEDLIYLTRKHFMTKQERLEYLKQLDLKWRKENPRKEKLLEVNQSHVEIEINSKSRVEIPVAEAVILDAVAVSSVEIEEAANEELPAFGEAIRDEETASEALTSDEK